MHSTCINILHTIGIGMVQRVAANHLASTPNEVSSSPPLQLEDV